MNPSITLQMFEERGGKGVSGSGGEWFGWGVVEILNFRYQVSV
jgi:hypothetical protein